MLYLQIKFFNTQNYIPFKIVGLYLKYSQNFANFSLGRYSYKTHYKKEGVCFDLLRCLHTLYKEGRAT